MSITYTVDVTTSTSVFFELGPEAFNMIADATMSASVDIDLTPVTYTADTSTSATVRFGITSRFIARNRYRR